MKRTGRTHRDLSRWWESFRQSAGDDACAQLAPQIEPLLEKDNGLNLSEGVTSPAHLLDSLEVLSELNADADCLAVMCDYFAWCKNQSEPQLDLTRQIIEIDRLEAAYDSEHASAEGLRRLLLAMVEDVRVVLIVLSDRLVRLRAYARADDESRRAFATLINAIHAPLANRLGIWQLKWEIEDFVFRFLEPDLYKRIAKLLAERRTDRERFIRRFIEQVNYELNGAGIKADVQGRPKHIYSIWKKMQRKGLAFNELHDIRAVRILVEDVPACYAALGIVHALWKPVPGEFDDYVANPKANNYRSLHTAVFGAEGKTVEVQIRTREMHEQAELGVAAHWRYKEGGAHDPSYQRKLNWMRQLLDSRDEGDKAALLDEFGTEGAEDRVYVLTPKGKVLDMRQGSTVLDFAYHIHTGVGNRCRGAKVNGRIVPLTYQVNNGEQVEILTAKEPDPSRDWLLPRLGYLRSSRARAKVRQWFRQKDRDRNLAEGRELLEKELKRMAAGSDHLEPLVKRFKLRDLDALYEAVAIGEVTSGQVASALQDLAQPDDDTDVLPLARAPSTRRRSKDDLVIEGVGNLLTNLAGCCNPVPGDAIVGFITKIRGVSIHRRDCPQVERLVHGDPARMLEVAWGDKTSDRYQAEIRVSAYDRKGLLKDIANLVSSSHSDILALQSNADVRDGTADVRLVVQVGDFDHLSYLLNRLSTLPNVIDVRRVG